VFGRGIKRNWNKNILKFWYIRRFRVAWIRSTYDLSPYRVRLATQGQTLEQFSTAICGGGAALHRICNRPPCRIRLNAPATNGHNSPMQQVQTCCNVSPGQLRQASARYCSSQLHLFSVPCVAAGPNGNSLFLTVVAAKKRKRKENMWLWILHSTFDQYIYWW
jgi:hypothetical protein